MMRISEPDSWKNEHLRVRLYGWPRKTVRFVLTCTMTCAAIYIVHTPDGSPAVARTASTQASQPGQQATTTLQRAIQDCLQQLDSTIAELKNDDPQSWGANAHALRKSGPQHWTIDSLGRQWAFNTVTGDWDRKSPKVLSSEPATRGAP